MDDLPFSTTRFLHRPAALAVALLLLVLPGCRASPPAGPPPTPEPPALLDRLLQLMRQRLVLMHEVARAKWNARLPVADPEREAALLQSVDAGARVRGLNPGFVRSFFAAQLEAARLIQQADFRRWEEAKQGPFEQVADLQALRARIDRLNEDVLNTLALLQPWLSRKEFQDAVSGRIDRVLSGEGIDDAVRAAASRPLRQRP